MTSKFTREELLNIIDPDHVQCGEASALARMALAAMDGESWCLPLDYLQGHKDGLEWASQLAEANHPDTGDWLYDDPIELVKAIRKGPDMPPSQPVADSEPDRNPVLAYADSYRDMAKQGVESVPIWSVITDLERNIAPLYRHAQPAPVEVKGRDELYDVIDGDDNVVLSAVSYNEAQTESDGYNGEDLYIVRHEAQPALVVPDEKDKTVDADDHPLLWSFNEGWNACRAAMLAAATQLPGSEPATVPGKWITVSERMPEFGDIVLTAMGGVVNVGETECSAANCRFFTSVISGRELPATHWMPLPVAPKEGKP